MEIYGTSDGKDGGLKEKIEVIHEIITTSVPKSLKLYEDICIGFQHMHVTAMCITLQFIFSKSGKNRITYNLIEMGKHVTSYLKPFVSCLQNSW